MIFDITIVIILGHHKLHPCKTVNLLSKRVRSDCATVPLSPSLSLGLPIPGDTILKIRPIIIIL